MPTTRPHRLPWLQLPLPAFKAAAGGALGLLRLWQRRARTRHELASLTAEQMRDAGLSPMMIRRESAKPFWEA